MTELATFPDLLRGAAIGAGATLVLDAWVLLLRRLGIPTMNFALLGRWVAHALRGAWKHESIARAAPVAREAALGWIAHYATGVAFAAAFVAACGAGWLREPRILPALAVGLLTVAAPFFVMQPAMGLGIAASKTPAPTQNRLRSLGNHVVFGFGLYLAASVIAPISR
jgi:hypothetical protein